MNRSTSTTGRHGGLPLRIVLEEGSFIDVWFSLTTFPKHFPNGSEADGDVEASHLSDDPETAVREFLTFVAEVPAEAGRDDAM
ncbi:MAG: hypothetical protein ABEK03_09765 [Candidatus Bipolaricaulia bacterium]